MIGRSAKATAAAMVLLAGAIPAGARAIVDGATIIIDGTNNTAASVAADIGDPALFSYEPALGHAVSTLNLLVAGELALGSEAEWDGLLRHALALELDVTECGSARIDVVRRGGQVGHLRLFRTKISASHREQDLDECSEANLLSVAGKLTMESSTITGNINVRYEPGAEARLERSTISFTRLSGMEMEGVSAGKMHVADSYSVDNALYGLSVSRLLSGPLEVVRTVLRGLAADVLVGEGADLLLRDCDLKTVRFAGRSGSLRRQWTVTCRLPHPGAEVVATSLPEAGLQETVSAVAGDDGRCELTLTEYAGSPQDPLPVQGRNKLTPHKLVVRDRHGGRELYELDGLHVFMRGQEVAFE